MQVERLTEYHRYDARSIVLRKLKLGRYRERKEDQMEEFVDMLFREQLGRNTGVPFAEVTRAARRQHQKHEAPEAVIDDLTTLFCSKTVAVVFKSIGIISERRDASDFLPKHFSWAHYPFLDLRLGADLGPELRVTFESEAVRSAVATFLSVSGIDFFSGQQRQRNAALRIQRAARRMAARHERERLRQTRKEASTTAAVLVRAFSGGSAADKSAARITREERLQTLRKASSTNAAQRPRACSVYVDGMNGQAAMTAEEAVDGAEDESTTQNDKAEWKPPQRLGPVRLVVGSARNLFGVGESEAGPLPTGGMNGRSPAIDAT